MTLSQRENLINLWNRQGFEYTPLELAIISIKNTLKVYKENL